MLKRYCDRCGKEIVSNIKMNEIEVKAPKEHYTPTYGIHYTSYWHASPSIDLCEECNKKLDELILSNFLDMNKKISLKGII